MSDDFVKSGVPKGMSMFAKIAIALVVCLVIGAGVITARMVGAYGAVTDATEAVWAKIAAADETVSDIWLSRPVQAGPVWGQEGTFSIEDSEIAFHQAQSSGTWTGADGRGLNFVMDFVSQDDEWLVVELTLTE